MSNSADNQGDGEMPDAGPASGGLTALERHTLLVEWNRTAREYPLDRCIHQLFEDQVRRSPDSVAAVDDSHSITYAELNTRTNRLARHLRTLGAGPETLVGICMERSVEMVVALLAILKAGAAYVPLDPAYPEERIHFILENAALEVVVTHRGLDARFADRTLKTVEADDLSPDTDGESPECLSTPSNLAYIIYTSGSTGKPKGVAIEHHNVVSFLCWVREVFSDEELSGVLAATSICFDLSVFEIFGTLCWGGRIILVDSAIDLPDSPHRRDVKLLNTVPSVMQTLLESGGMPDSVITVNLAGEPLRPSLVDALYACPHVRQVNDLYGPSETTTYSTWAVRRPHQPATIGRPIANTSVYLLDPDLNPVPIGVAGELFIGGEGVARGYLHAPELTVEKFIPDPFAGKPGARIYRTGDMVRYRKDGNLEYLGRADQQVKIRGYRVEPGEIESVLSAHPDLAACAVVARTNNHGEKSLVACVVVRENAGLSVSSLRHWLGERIPEYMIPSRFTVLPDLPLTPNGKIDRKRLEKLDGIELDAAAASVPPRTDAERELVSIWEKLLDRGQVGIRDNFFDLGGNSLLAARLVAEIKSRWSVSLPVAAIFQSPVIEELATRLTEDGWSPSWKSLVPLQPAGTKKPLFLIHGWGGDVFCFVGLARLLGPDQPVYGVQAVGLDGKEPPHADVTTMVAHYAREIRAFQPEGPYFIGGYSLGGLFAFEVARQLHESGRRVAMLVLFDSDPVGTISWTVMPYLVQRCTFHLKRLWTMPNRERLAYFRRGWDDLQGRMTSDRHPTSPAESERVSPEDPEAKDYYHALALAHRLHPYPGPATVFVSDDSVSGHMSYWRHLVRGGLTFREIPGTHFEILTPENVPRLAAALQAELTGLD
ncbi:MAG: amino acid adenylation domain-containing protein [Verrucomicrobiota bacterium]